MTDGGGHGHLGMDRTMRAEPDRRGAWDELREPEGRPAPRWCLPAVLLAAVVGIGMMADSARSISATYDEVAYLRIAATWWRTGAQNEITRMGSPLTFWKLQQAPVLWLCDLLGQRALVDEPIAHQAELLPLVRIGALWVWLLALGLTSYWSRCLYGPRAMAFAAWLFALGPNLLAHGALVTMELPLVACTTGVVFLFWRFLQSGQERFFWVAAAVAGLGFSCKFTAILLPPILGAVWWIDRWRKEPDRPARAAWRVAVGMTGFVGVMLLVDLVVTQFVLLPLSHTSGGGHPSLDGRFARWPWLGRLVARGIETPIPQDWVGFATQVRHQRSGGPSYLFGERRMHGWWYYYFVALAVKVPLSFWLLSAARAKLGRRAAQVGHSWILPVIVGLFLTATAVGSSRNYGLRYLLPLFPLAIVWVSALAERSGWPRLVASIGLLGGAVAIASVHPHELTYFNVLAGGRAGGRHVLADSNLDWGGGLKSLARLQRDRPELRDLTLYYFGDTKPRHYGVVGTSHVIDAGTVHPGLPSQFAAETPFVAVSASLQWGPWGPPGYFRCLDGVRPVMMTDDTTIAIYRTADAVARLGHQ
jgi:4-amino-4-deoxy-L-arabinose transferase-like glycosyltransferase